jgi:ferrochelatase
VSEPSQSDPKGEKTGVLLVNLGTPEAPRTPEVRRYLREFLSDPRVLDMNPVGRWLLLNLVILPFRPARSAEAYRQIWTGEGAPLMVHSRALARKVQAALGGAYEVVLGMRYGKPSIRSALEALHAQGLEKIVVFPLYPQYASSTTGSTVEEVFRVAGQLWNVPWLVVIPPFYDDAGSVRSLAVLGRPVLEEMRPERVLFSFHGLPERHVREADGTGRHCLEEEGCCDEIGEANRYCYRAHCYETARLTAAALDLEEGSWSVAFQSRLGREPWLQPYTDETVRRLAEQGVKRLAVFCPAFVADCLETLEEIGIRAREEFLAHGGEDLRLVPSLNSEPIWVEAVARLVRRAAWRAG